MPILSLDQDTLQHLALAIADVDPIGPPKHLAAFLQTCSAIYHALSLHSNPSLFADIFRRQFDTAALARRLPQSQLTARHLAAELVRRWTVLSRIRKAASSPHFSWNKRYYTQPLLVEDLTTAYLLLTESDGKNAVQLLQYANLELYLSKLSNNRIEPVHVNPTMPPESHEAAFWLWLTWMVTDYRKLVNIGDRPKLKWLTTPYILGTFAYKNSFAPWTTPALPLALSTSSPIQPAPRTPSPPLTENASPFFIADLTVRQLPTVEINYFGAPLRIASPIASHAAVLYYIASLQRCPIPVDRMQPEPTADVLLAGLETFESQGQISASASGLARIRPELAGLAAGRRNWTPSHMQIQLPSLARSEVWDDDVRRLIGCHNPFATLPAELGMPRYRWTKGSLAGAWDGRFILPDLDTYRDVMTGPTDQALNRLEEALLLQDLQAWAIEEHYHVPQNVYVNRYRNSAFRRAAVAPPPAAGHPLRAFLPDHLEMRRRPNGDGLDVWDGRRIPRDGDVAFYETWKEGPRGNDVAEEDEDMMDIDDEEEADDNDDPEATLSILLTGYSIPRVPSIPTYFPTMMGENSYIRGTVRKWDGLITLSAVPPEGPGGSWIWRGYLVGDGNFVGRYREASMDVRRNAYEGVFVMRRRV